MKNLFISFCLFAIMLVAILFSLNYLNKICNNLEILSSKIEESVNNENWQQAYDESLELISIWEKDSRDICIFVHHAEIDNISSELFKLTQFAKCKTTDESLASIHFIKLTLKHICDIEKINLKNIL